MQIAIVVLSASCIITGIWPQSLSTLLPHASSLDVYSASGVKTALTLVASGIVCFILLARVLEKEIKLALPIAVKLVVDRAALSTYNNIFKAAGAFRNLAFRSAFRLMQRTDYKPGKRGVFQFINVANIDFDVLLLMFMLGVALVFLFYLQFGVYAVGL